jgi:hypothetical protein
MRIAAGIVFLLGILLMAGTFYLAYTLFTDPRAGIFPPTGSGTPALNLTDRILIAVVRVGLLFVMGFAGSAIASKGIALYEATRLRYE